MREIIDLVITAIAAVLTMSVIVFICNTLNDCNAAYSNDNEGEIISAIEKLKPEYRGSLAASWAAVIHSAALETDIDQLLITALAFRESSLREDVIGDLGEQGPMQLHGAALSYLPRGCNPQDKTCSIRGGSALLCYWKARCKSESWAVWTSAYGLGRCPSVADAQKLSSTKRLFNLYTQIGGRQWQ